MIVVRTKRTTHASVSRRVVESTFRTLYASVFPRDKPHRTNKPRFVIMYRNIVGTETDTFSFLSVVDVFPLNLKLDVDASLFCSPSTRIAVRNFLEGDISFDEV
jgi:hypothetical protein